MTKRIGVLVLSLGIAASSFAAAPKTYQVTGPVLEINDNVIVVQKGKDKWEIDKGAAKITGDLKVGSKVTIEYRMTAATITATAAPAAKPAKKK